LADDAGARDTRAHLIRTLKWILPAAAIAAAWVVGVSLLWPTDVPGNLHLPDLDPHAFFGPHQLEEARDYEAFTRINTLLSVVVLVVVLVLYARHGERFTRESAAGRIGTGMLLGMLGFAFVWLAQLPFGLVQLWWDRRHDVSDQGYLDWLVSTWFSLGDLFLAVCVAILIVMALARPLRDNWWVVGAPLFVALSLLVTFTGPFFIPQTRPLKDDQLAADARRFAKEEGVPDIPVRVEDVDEFTDEPNAFAIGLGPTRRVFLWNTLLRKPFSKREVRVVIAHELGHHSRDHLWKLSGWFALVAVPAAWGIALLTRRRGGMYEARAVPLALLAVIVLQIVITPAQNVVSRRYEAEADWVSLGTTRDPRAASELHKELAEKSLSDPDPPGWAFVLFDTHPTAMQRIAMARAWRERNLRHSR
jgi:Zn-dependent protease with chaperone function